MTEQTNGASNDNGGQGYNITVTVKGAINTAPTVKGTRKLTFRGTAMIRGKERERTYVAQGSAADTVADKIDEAVKNGQPVKLRCLFSEAPAREEGQRGAEFMTIIGLPLPPKQKAA